MRKYIIVVLSTLFVSGLAVGAYYYGTQKSTFDNKKEILENPTQLPNTEENLPTAESQPSIDVSEQIVAAITSKNTQALEGYMADIVQVRLESSGCCGPITKAEAISQLSYLDSAVGWSFDPTNPIIINLATSVPDFYGSGWLVGVADNEYIVSFKLNNQNKIEAYNLGASYKLLIP
ncbi:hypothetical protein KKE60_00175 [Patescibacteria group bacterium]|nr:hypothetical protein [Patescibacteria group bacterium]MBU0776999.1 hypothetical protein [Patescibacteria group bacterium]MBU0923029.1 hypothetical protein [Patescibacteria group bacterium]MBU1066204.1 hypothetical protein [Patescibacteria group bacterium]MBU1844603.1 hypothetical protein [Patescibacteria group bacterium]